MSISKGRRFEDLVLDRSAEWKDGYPPFMDFSDALELVLMKPEDCDPLRPSKEMGIQLLNSVRAALSSGLKNRCGQELITLIVKNTGLYPGVKTAADYWHGVDFAICCDLGGNIAPAVTGDLKARPDPGEEIRDDHVIITKSHFTEVDSGGRLRLDNIGGVIADILISKLEHLGVIGKELVMAS